MNEKEFIEELHKIGIDLTDKQILQFSDYADILLEYNSHTNITAIRDKESIYLKHFYDSLLVLKYVDLSQKKVLDIGSGGGFPGVPLKIVIPSIELVSLDSNGKKTKFQTELKKKLSIDFEIINDRAENYIKERRENFDVVLSRAVANLPILAELCLPFVKITGFFIAYKGVIDNEIEDGTFAIETLGGEITSIKQDILSSNNAQRSLIIVEKKCKTPDEYPRLFDKISKKPLQKK